MDDDEYVYRLRCDVLKTDIDPINGEHIPKFTMASFCVSHIAHMNFDSFTDIRQDIRKTYLSWEKRKHRFKTIFTELGRPDILCLQDMDTWGDSGSFKCLLEELGYDYKVYWKRGHEKSLEDNFYGKCIAWNSEKFRIVSYKPFHFDLCENVYPTVISALTNCVAQFAMLEYLYDRPTYNETRNYAAHDIVERLTKEDRISRERPLEEAPETRDVCYYSDDYDEMIDDFAMDSDDELYGKRMPPASGRAGHESSASGSTAKETRSKQEESEYQKRKKVRVLFEHVSKPCHKFIPTIMNGPKNKHCVLSLANVDLIDSAAFPFEHARALAALVSGFFEFANSTATAFADVNELPYWLAPDIILCGQFGMSPESLVMQAFLGTLRAGVETTTTTTAGKENDSERAARAPSSQVVVARESSEKLRQALKPSFMELLKKFGFDKCYFSEVSGGEEGAGQETGEETGDGDKERQLACIAQRMIGPMSLDNVANIVAYTHMQLPLFSVYGNYKEFRKALVEKRRQINEARRLDMLNIDCLAKTQASSSSSNPDSSVSLNGNEIKAADTQVKNQGWMERTGEPPLTCYHGKERVKSVRDFIFIGCPEQKGKLQKQHSVYRKNGGSVRAKIEPLQILLHRDNPELPGLRYPSTHLPLYARFQIRFEE